VFATKALQKIKNYFSRQAEEPLQGLLCQNRPRRKVLFANTNSISKE
jgi:hypothetical protein